MKDILFYPLLDKDPSGNEKQPLFPSMDENTVKSNHRIWLKVVVPEYYRLCSSETIPAKDALKMQIHCPACGEIMRPFSKAAKGNALPIFICGNCLDEN